MSKKNSKKFYIILLIFVIVISITAIILLTRTHRNHDTYDQDVPTNLPIPVIPVKPTFHPSTTSYNTNIWKMQGSQYSFPEFCSGNLHGNKVPDINGVSLALSAGGAKSFSSLIGYFRALNRMGYKNKAQYISTVSGGSWFYSLYSYCQSNPSFTDNVLLGQSVGVDPVTGIPNPSKMTMKDLKTVNSSNPHCFANVISKSNFLELLAENWFSSQLDRLWGNTIGQYLFKIYNINPLSPFALNAAHAADISSRNLLTPSPIYPPNNMPFWICNTTLAKDTFPYVPIVMTPLYSGLHQTLTKGDVTLGGELIETYAFGAGVKSHTTGFENLGNCIGSEIISMQKIGNTTTISDAIGSSSNAYSIGLYDFKEKYPILGRILPADPQSLISNYTVSGTSSNGNIIKEQIFLNDGGQVDDNGIVSLVARGVKHIICFTNGTGAPPTFVDECNISLLFGAANDKLCSQYYLSLKSTQVFETSDYTNIILPQFNTSATAGGPIFARASLKVKPNANCGVAGNYMVDILFIILGTIAPRRFLNSLPQEVIKQINVSSALFGDFYGFPSFPVIGQNYNLGLLSELLDQSNLLSSYTDWTLSQPEISNIVKEMFSRV